MTGVLKAKVDGEWVPTSPGTGPAGPAGPPGADYDPAAADLRYVNVTGDTMTGILRLQQIDGSGTGSSLRVSTCWMPFQDGANYYDAISHVFRSPGGETWLTVNVNEVTATRTLWLPADPTQPLQAATKQYVDAEVAKVDEVPGPTEERWGNLSVTTDASGNALVTFSKPFPTGHVPAAMAAQGFPNVHVTVWGSTENYVQLHYQRHDGSNVVSTAITTQYRAWWPTTSPT